MQYESGQCSVGPGGMCALSLQFTHCSCTVQPSTLVVSQGIWSDGCFPEAASGASASDPFPQHAHLVHICSQKQQRAPIYR